MAALATTHLDSSAPVETHVFVSLLHRLPLLVVTDRGQWQVSGTNITFLEARNWLPPPP